MRTPRRQTAGLAALEIALRALHNKPTTNPHRPPFRVCVFDMDARGTDDRGRASRVIKPPPPLVSPDTPAHTLARMMPPPAHPTETSDVVPAFCFLVMDSFPYEREWAEYLGPAVAAGTARVAIHTKSDATQLHTQLFRDARIPSQPTRWGDASIVWAQNAALRAVLTQTPGARPPTHVMLSSGDALPIKRWDRMLARLAATHASTFVLFNQGGRFPRFSRLLPAIATQHILFVHQWCILTATDAAALAWREAEYRPLWDAARVHAPDEVTYASMLAHWGRPLNLVSMKDAPAFLLWPDIVWGYPWPPPRYASAHHPKTFVDVPQHELRWMVDKHPGLLARKFAENATCNGVPVGEALRTLTDVFGATPPPIAYPPPATAAPSALALGHGHGAHTVASMHAEVARLAAAPLREGEPDWMFPCLVAAVLLLVALVVVWAALSARAPKIRRLTIPLS